MKCPRCESDQFTQKQRDVINKFDSKYSVGKAFRPLNVKKCYEHQSGTMYRCNRCRNMWGWE